MFENKKAKFDYTFLEHETAGMCLKTEHILAIRAGKFSLSGAYIKIVSEEAFLLTEHHSIKLLLTKKQLSYFNGKVRINGLALIPLQVVVKNKRFKLEFALAKGKKAHDKREAKKNHDVDLENRRIVKSQKLL